MSDEMSTPEPGTAFDDNPRDSEEPADHLVGRFDYLNASGRPKAAMVRALIDQWLADHPATHRSDLIHRLRSRHDTSQRSATFELMLHALLRRQGFTIFEVEPELPNGKAPEFLGRGARRRALLPRGYARLGHGGCARVYTRDLFLHGFRHTRSRR